jgi:hypothetical protein
VVVKKQKEGSRIGNEKERFFSQPNFISLFLSRSHHSHLILSVFFSSFLFNCMLSQTELLRFHLYVLNCFPYFSLFFILLQPTPYILLFTVCAFPIIARENRRRRCMMHRCTVCALTIVVMISVVFLPFLQFL